MKQTLKLIVFAVALLAGISFGAEPKKADVQTEIEIGTNSSASDSFDPTAAPLPTNRETAALYLVSIISALLTWALTKIPNIPRPVLPIAAPVFGLIFGFALHKFQAMPWWTPGLTAIAGSAGVGMREIINQNITKRFKPREQSKTDAVPLDDAKAIKDPKA